MPIKYRVDRERHLVLVHAEGAITIADQLAYAKVFADSGLVGCDELACFENVTANFNSRDVALLASRMGDIFGPTGTNKTATVAPSDADYGLARQYQLFRDRPLDRLQVFRDMKDAIAWLGLDPEFDYGDAASDQWITVG